VVEAAAADVEAAVGETDQSELSEVPLTGVDSRARLRS
jgi:hypothetical protein